jgi:signal transduction histidine kinase
MLDEAVEDIRNKAEEKKMEFSVKKIKNMPNIYGDPEKLKMAIYYILDNAVKYTRKNGKVLIEVKNKNRKKDLAFKIKDNGVGIPTEGKEELFSKFYRASNVLRMQTDGNGLGLFIVKSIIEKHKGNINIDSKEGEGTEVELVIPIREDKKKLGSG